jgi:hypothetical protein
MTRRTIIMLTGMTLLGLAFAASPRVALAEPCEIEAHRPVRGDEEPHPLRPWGGTKSQGDPCRYRRAGQPVLGGEHVHL